MATPDSDFFGLGPPDDSPGGSGKVEPLLTDSNRNLKIYYRTPQPNRLVQGIRGVGGTVGSWFHRKEAAEPGKNDSKTGSEDAAVLADILNKPEPREAISSLIGRLTGHIPRKAGVVTEVIRRSASSAMEQRIFGQRLGDIVVEGVAGTVAGQSAKTLARMALGMSGVGIEALIISGAVGGVGTAVVKEYLHQRKEFNAKKVEDAGLTEAKEDLKESFRINRGRMAKAALRGAIVGAVGGVVGVGIAEMALEGISPVEWWGKLMANTKLPEINLSAIKMPDLSGVKLPDFSKIIGGGQAHEAVVSGASADATATTGVGSESGDGAPVAETSTTQPAAETPVPAAQTPIPTPEPAAVPQAPAIPADATAAEAPPAPAAPVEAVHTPEPISHVTAPNGAVVSGSTLDNSLAYNGQPWHLAENGTKNLGHLLTAAGQPPDINPQVLNAKLQEAAALWANGQLDPNTDLYMVFHFSNGTGDVYSKLFNKDTISSLRNLGIISK